jgi:hypothetical protein
MNAWMKGCVGAALLMCPVASADVGWSSASDSRVWLEGDSSLRPYRTEATDLHATFQMDPLDAPASGDALEAAICAGKARHLELRVIVKSLRSGVALLDEHLASALNASEYPAVIFRARRCEVLPPASGAGCSLKLHGRLFVAGVGRDIDVTADVSRAAAGIRITGSKTLEMKDYGIRAPVLMFGAIKTYEHLVVKFDVGVRGVPLVAETF